MKKDISPEEFEKLREKLREENGIESPSSYRCKYCDEKVSFMFPMKFLKEQQICPDCFHKEDEDNLVSLEEQMKELQKKIDSLKGKK